MSFTADVNRELISQEIGKTCCRKALLLGMFFGSKSQAVDNNVSAVFRMREAADLAAELLKRQFSAVAAVEEATVGGRRVAKVSVRSKALAAFIAEAKSSQKSVGELAGFRCASCSHEFLRGVFLSAATINDPKKSYHLEFSLKGENEGRLFFDFLSSEIAEPKLVQRGNGIGVYYKRNLNIGDVLYYVGAAQASFDFANACIEHDIRNVENRATNCVARNISRAVNASQKHIAAIEYLRAAGKLSLLSEELIYTATLREENDSASLSELAMLHNPPITKSGLNQRLNKILKCAEELKDKQ